MAGIGSQFCLLQLSDIVQRFGTLLQVVVIDGRHNIEFGTGIFQSGPFVAVDKQIVVFANAPHTPQRTVAIIVKLLVKSRTLVDLHKSDVGNQQLQFVFGQAVDFPEVSFGFFKIHPHKGTKAQIIAGFGFAGTIQIDRLISLHGCMTRRIDVFIAESISLLVERINQSEFLAGRSTDTRPHCYTGAKQRNKPYGRNRFHKANLQIK